jgi:hypothetical protein
VCVLRFCTGAVSPSSAAAHTVVDIAHFVGLSVVACHLGAVVARGDKWLSSGPGADVRTAVIPNSRVDVQPGT